jgi:hypothetical protein
MERRVGELMMMTRVFGGLEAREVRCVSCAWVGKGGDCAWERDRRGDK